MLVLVHRIIEQFELVRKAVLLFKWLFNRLVYHLVDAKYRMAVCTFAVDMQQWRQKLKLVVHNQLDFCRLPLISSTLCSIINN